MSSTEAPTSTDEDPVGDDGTVNEKFLQELVDAGVKQIHAKKLAEKYTSIEDILVTRPQPPMSQYPVQAFWPRIASDLNLKWTGKAFQHLLHSLLELSPYDDFSEFDEIRFISYMKNQLKPKTLHQSISRIRGPQPFIDCHGMEISNFKGFSDRRSFAPIRPLTLIYGPNNSGKSSILKALGSFTQSHHRRVTDDATIDWSPIGNWFDLGESPQILHEYDSESFKVGYIFRIVNAQRVPMLSPKKSIIRTSEDEYLKLVFEIGMDKGDLQEQGSLRSIEFWKGDSEDFMNHLITLSSETVEPMRYGKSHQPLWPTRGHRGRSPTDFLKEGQRVFRVDLIDDELIKEEKEKSIIRENLLMEILNLPDVDDGFEDALLSLLNQRILGNFTPHTSFKSIEEAKVFEYWPRGTLALYFINEFWSSIYATDGPPGADDDPNENLTSLISEIMGGYDGRENEETVEDLVREFFKTYLPLNFEFIQGSKEKSPDFRPDRRGRRFITAENFFEQVSHESSGAHRFSLHTLSALKPLLGQVWDFSWNTGIDETRGGTPSWPSSLVNPANYMGGPHPSQSRHIHTYLRGIQECLANASNLINNADYLSATRLLPMRLYSSSSGSNSTQGLDGSRTLSVLADDRAALKEINEKLEDMIGIKLRITRSSAAFKDKSGERRTYRTNRLNVRVVGPEGDTKLQLPDIGFGASQVIPILSAARTSHTVIVEEPESNLHPAAQAKLMSHIVDLMLGRASSSGQTRPMIMETHSEHFLMKLLDEISNPECPLSDDDVAIIYVEKKDGATQVRRMTTTDGALDQEFPDEFSGRKYRRSII